MFTFLGILVVIYQIGSLKLDVRELHEQLDELQAERDRTLTVDADGPSS